MSTEPRRHTFGFLAVCALGAVLADGAPARADIIAAMPNTVFDTVPTTINFGPASFTFSALAGGPAGVATGGTGQVTSFFGGVADFFAGASIDQNGELYGFSSFPAAAAIPNSAADDYIGIDFSLADGLHYGYAEVSGTQLVSYAYQTVANASIAAGQVPEPATFGVLGVGLVGLGAVWRRRNREIGGQLG